MAKALAKHLGDNLVEAEVRGHKVRLDVPQSWGGSERAMYPPELTAASLAACTLVTINKYCQEAGLDCKDTQVEVEYTNVEGPAYFGPIKIKIIVPHADLKGREKALLKVANHCTVHGILTNKHEIEVSIK